ncbi:hypothetical protein DICPUDRAFT_79102 [Dictyostelium purpureum]|uniref:Peptidase A1 domain-containing protein n=1 Tax=Dictyostelium purpureum TaxID=5786 RepID=F0ZLK4_DICPU|nr:uncharacterized protein DICPUDRAFT_79102 [Dictyostelium purpureum]EGC35168.1 hypothetical protein DICPUDRAFT_79102 [Dictyostelium purpureum]|eukprot:XP_003288306.1 hypothetical protein DICPUDRAFT_79102 [Dictyostelium purpureum]
MKSILLLSIFLIFVFNNEYANANRNSLKLPIYTKQASNHINNNFNDLASNKRMVSTKERNVPIKLEGDIIQLLIDVNVGGIKQQVVVDTGSNYLVVPSVYCRNCEQQRPYYQPSKYATFMKCNDECSIMGNSCTNVQTLAGIELFCSYQESYVQGTEILNLLVQDTFSFNNYTENVMATFGIIVTTQGHTLRNGVLGLGKTCRGCRKSPTASILENLNLSNSFSLSFNENFQGTLVLGDADPSDFDKNLTFTEMLTIDDSHYGVPIKSIIVNDRYSPNYMLIPPEYFGDFILDSGATMTSLNEPAYNLIAKFLQRDCNPGMCHENNFFNGYCFDFPDEYFNTFPIINIEMEGGASMKIEPKNYIFSNYVNGIKYHCLDHYVHFDNENEKIGIAKRPYGYSYNNNF